MDKNKLIAAVITSLFLFAVIRACSPKEVVEKQQQEDEVYTEEDKAETVEDLKPVKVAPPKPIKKKVILSNEEPVKKLKLLKELKTEDSNVGFASKSDFTFFKITDGLALVGGDVILGELSEEQKEKDFSGKLLKQKPEPSKLWPSAQVPVGFAVGFPEHLKKEVNLALEYFNKETVMEFVAADPEIDQDIIVFQLRENAPCSSYLGRTGGQQPIYLNSKNCKAQDVLHELMHALAFVHEQQREERDYSLKILWDNIKEEYSYNFAILPDSMVHPYQGSVFNIDFTSVMMYPDVAFAKGNTKSMKSLSRAKIAPTNKGLSDIDKKRLEFLYGS
jgi:hypothetical protein